MDQAELMRQECETLATTVLPLIDLEEWRRERRHEQWRERAVDRGLGDRLHNTFLTLTLCLTVHDQTESGHSLTLDTLYQTPLATVAHRTIHHQPHELLAVAPQPGEARRQDVEALRLLGYETGSAARVYFALGNETHRSLQTLIRTHTASATCASLRQWFVDAGLLN